MRSTLGITVAAAAALAAPAFGQYGGPALLTRGQAPTAMSAAQIDFRPFLSVNAGYSTGLNGVSVDPAGNPTNASSFSASVTGGVSGLHSWRHTVLGLDYRLSLNHYTSQSFFDGSDQNLMLGVTHQFTRHVTLAIRNTAGMFSQNYATPALQQTVPFDPATANIPTNDFFDNRTIFLTSQADLRVQKSTRLSYDIGVDGFLTVRRSHALYGNKGAGARGDVEYRISKRSTIGGYYAFTHYTFDGVVSDTDAHTVGGAYAIALSRTIEFGSMMGLTFYETKFIRQIPIDPVVAAVICTPTTIGLGQCVATQISYSRSHTPNISARLSKTIPRGVLFVTGGHSISQGNGLFLTSTSTTANAGYSYTGLKRWGVNTGVTYSNSNSVGNVTGNYSGVTLNANVSRQIANATHFVFGFSGHKYNSPDFHNYNRWIYSINAGLGFTPGDIPIRLW